MARPNSGARLSSLVLCAALGVAIASSSTARAQTRGAEPVAETSSIDKMFAVVARMLPLSPILFPIGNEVSVDQWISSCVTSNAGWTRDLTCYGGGWKVPPEPPVSRRIPEST